MTNTEYIIAGTITIIMIIAFMFIVVKAIKEIWQILSGNF